MLPHSAHAQPTFIPSKPRFICTWIIAVKELGVGYYETLAKLLVLQNVFNMEACIAHCDPADEYVPATSRLFHERLGFKLVGKFNKCAHKFGRWYDMIWMERILGDHIADPQPFCHFRKLIQKKLPKY